MCSLCIEIPGVEKYDGQFLIAERHDVIVTNALPRIKKAIMNLGGANMTSVAMRVGYVRSRVGTVKELVGSA